ncbi:hypothetical protein LIER_38335 [Lithospermum erythrorhizon]|uniref:Uncharacterized protein n=1 Tax=Lithospermum erythrorhizon TaxID=34254 RepID=A0AAV3PY23_LITER
MPAASAFENFKASAEYIELLKGDTAVMLRDFCQNVSSDLPSISSHFRKYVSRLGEDYAVDLFEDLPEEIDEDSDSEDGDEDFLL